MSSSSRSGPGFRLSTLSAALAAAVLLLAALAGSAAAFGGDTSLRDAFVGPRVGTLDTVIRFSVTFQGQGERASAHVRVVIDGTSRELAPTPGGALSFGIRYRTSASLPVGTHHVAFTGEDGTGATAYLEAGTVRIHGGSDGGTGGTGTGSGTTGTGGKGGTTTTGGSGGGDKGGSGTGSGSAGPKASPTPAPDGAAGHTTKGSGSSGSGGSTGPGAGPAKTPQPTGDAVGPVATPSAAPSEDGLALGSSTGAGSDGGGSGGPGAQDGAPSVLTGGRDEISPAERMLISAISTTTAVTVGMAFFMFGKRRRDGDPPAPDEVLAANAARLATTPASALVSGLRDGGPAGRADESAMPRWRRPSLIEARKNDPIRSAIVHDRQSFDHATVTTVAGAERRRIRYRAVSLLDAPDELRATVLEELDEGDEVQLVERSGGYWFVLCPDGGRGWVHRMTLGDVVVDAGRAGGFNAARRSFAPPGDGYDQAAADEADGADGADDLDGTDGMDEAEEGPNLLSAYLASIHRP